MKFCSIVILSILLAGPVLAISGGHGIPSPQQPAVPPRTAIGDFGDWWNLNRDHVLIVPPWKETEQEGETLEEYTGGTGESEEPPPPPDSVEDLLGLVGYEGHFSSIVLELALQRLRRIPDAEERLIDILTSRRELPPRRAWAAYALGELSVDAAVPALVDAAEDRGPDLAGFAVRALGRIGGAGSEAAIRKVAEDRGKGDDLRCIAILSLAESGEAGRGTLRSIAERDNSVTARRAALMALGVGPSAEDLAAIREGAEARDPNVRAAAAIGLGLAGSEGRLLREALAEDRDPLVRGCAALALGIEADPDNAAALVGALKEDRDSTVRGAAALALGRTGGEGGIGALGEAMADPRYGPVCTYAAVGLGLSKDPAALPHLLRGLASRQEDVLTAAIVGLTLLGDGEGIPHLERQLGNRQFPAVREFAYFALGCLKGEGIRTRIQEGLEDRTPDVRLAVSLALAVYGDPDARAALEPVAEKDREESVRHAAALAVDVLTNEPDRALLLGERFRADPRQQGSATMRRVGIPEVRRLLNDLFPDDYRIPVTP